MKTVLTINAGSSSLKFAAYDVENDLTVVMDGQIENIGKKARLIVDHGDNRKIKNLGAIDHHGAMAAVLKVLRKRLAGRVIHAVGHRIVHGGVNFSAPQILTPDVIAELETYIPFAPLHQPHNLNCVQAAIASFPGAIQIGCFDTAFHRDHPWVNDTFALPRRFYDEGVRRYGFHGLSYDYITSVLERDYPELHDKKVVIAHLGNGASMCAIRQGQSVGSTMGFSALDGLPMGTRCGQIDPGVLLYLMDQKQLSATEITNILYKESGMLGLSGISGDMRTLQASDAPEAAQALDYYTFRVAREIGAMSAVLGGIDALVFCGGIGENSAHIRARATQNLGYLGIKLNLNANAWHEREISDGPTRVFVIPTDEERVIARAAKAHIAT
ncbi:acetate/propionate family kinase [Aestuariibius sp. HNIBRBA575]|uniref:acetate/propionate family kinase n=1 Tax=Aestuariibius sp. HNIBRBA575 TaxID=3233343 RepID=UPI0034A3FC4B